MQGDSENRGQFLQNRILRSCEGIGCWSYGIQLPAINVIDDEDDKNWRMSSLPKGANNEEMIAD